MIRISKQVFKNHDLVIDFSSPQSLEKSLEICEELGLPLISGTTGISDGLQKKLKLASKKIPALWSPNMSIGIAVLKKAIQLLGQLEDFDFQVEEFHHNQKKDRPSGTALALQQTLKKSLAQKKAATLPEPLVVRAGGIVGIHKVYATSQNEMICFEHTAMNRKVFADGALLAGEWLIGQQPGLYTMEDLFV